MSNGWVLSLLKGAMKKAKNDSMSWIDVRDCAALHIAAMENPNATGRYINVVESLHWNDNFRLLKKLYPAMAKVEDCDGEPVTPT